LIVERGVAPASKQAAAANAAGKRPVQLRYLLTKKRKMQKI
jgi:hypothetical protein